MNSELKIKLEQLALQKSTPFCYSCYKEVSTDHCECCGSDDNMRLLHGFGCEYGLDWVYEEILKENLTPIDTNEAFEETVRSSLESDSIKLGWMTLDAITVMKEQDPISWDMAKSEWEDFESSDENIISFNNGGTYYWMDDVENFLEDNL